MMLIFDAEGMIVHGNQAVCQSLSYRPEVMSGMRLENIIAPEDRHLIKQLYQENSEATSLRLINRSGESHYVSWATVRDPINGQLLASITDRTVEEQRLTKLAEAREYSESLLKAKSNFLSQLSHEVRTPLNGIIGLSDMLLNRGQLDETDRENVALIGESGHSLLTLLNNILDLSQIDNGSLQVTPSEVASPDLWRPAASIGAANCQSKGIEWKLSVTDDFPARIWVDARAVSRTLVNLVHNACKFTQQGSVSLEIFLRPVSAQYQKEQRGTMAQLDCTVRDTGIGIKPESIEKLFLTVYAS